MTKEMLQQFMEGKVMTLLCAVLALPFLIMMSSLSRKFQPMTKDDE